MWLFPGLKTLWALMWLLWWPFVQITECLPTVCPLFLRSHKIWGDRVREAPRQAPPLPNPEKSDLRLSRTPVKKKENQWTKVTTHSPGLKPFVLVSLNISCVFFRGGGVEGPSVGDSPCRSKTGWSSDRDVEESCRESWASLGQNCEEERGMDSAVSSWLQFILVSTAKCQGLLRILQSYHGNLFIRTNSVLTKKKYS